MVLIVVVVGIMVEVFGFVGDGGVSMVLAAIVAVLVVVVMVVGVVVVLADVGFSVCGCGDGGS